jgi:hypothetical protein
VSGRIIRAAPSTAPPAIRLRGEEWDMDRLLRRSIMDFSPSTGQAIGAVIAAIGAALRLAAKRAIKRA